MFRLLGYLKHVAAYGVLIAIVWALAVYLPGRLARVNLAEDYSDVEGIPMYAGYSVEPGMTAARLKVGDAIAFRVGDAQGYKLGWVAALPGEEVALAGGKLLVGGKEAPNWKPVSETTSGGPLPVPAGHVFVRSDGHGFDSVNWGPIPEAAIHGRIIGSFP